MRHYGLTAKIIESCAVHNGRDIAELQEITGGKGSSIASLVGPMRAAGQLYRAGIAQHYRYFKHEADAQAFELIAPALHAEQRKAAAERKAAAFKALIEKRAEERASRPKRASKPREKAAEPAKPQRGTERRKSGIVLPREANAGPIAPKAVEIVWPEHVKVQVCPSGRDTRFTFEPPPGWVGQFEQDWRNRARCKPRREAGSEQAAAHDFLDRVKERTVAANEAEVSAALIATGDIGQREQVGNWRAQ